MGEFVLVFACIQFEKFVLPQSFRSDCGQQYGDFGWVRFFLSFPIGTFESTISKFLEAFSCCDKYPGSLKSCSVLKQDCFWGSNVSLLNIYKKIKRMCNPKYAGKKSNWNLHILKMYKQELASFVSLSGSNLSPVVSTASSRVAWYR